MDNQLVADLIEDAELVANFGSRRGLLPDEKIFHAIQSAKSESKGDGDGASSEAYFALQGALNDALKAIRPVDLSDLKSEWEPFENKKRWYHKWNLSRVFFLLLTVIGTLSAHSYSQWQFKAEAVIRMHENGDHVRVHEVVQELDDLFLLDASFLSNASTLSQSDEVTRRAFFEKLREAKAAVQKAHGAQSLYIDVISDYYKFYSAASQLSWEPLLEDYFIFQAAKRIPMPTTIASFEDRCLELLSTGNSENTLQFEKELPSGFKQASDTYVANSRRVSYLYCISGYQRLGTSTYDDLDMLEKTTWVSAWILPAIYGALGALVYHLRACLDRYRPDPRFARALMRTFLGAFAGVAFGWLWPNTTNDGILTILPLGVYALAFLIGYSIDIFFALLDKLVVTLSSSIENVGKTSGQDT